MRASLASIVVVLAAIAVSGETAAGVQWTAPAGWKPLGAQPMRAATYSVPPAAGDTMAAECGVYFFGAGQGGSVEANLERWKGQFADASGKAAPAKVDKQTIHGLAVTTIDTSGMYSGMGGPFAAGKPVPGYRLMGAIVEAPGGNIFLKFTGPAKTIAANQQKFRELLGSFQRAR